MNNVVASQLEKIKKIRKRVQKEETTKVAQSTLGSATFVRFSSREQTLFAKRMSFLIKAGVPIIECIHIIRSQTKSKTKKKIYDSILNDVANGQYLATSLSKFKRFFGDFAINLIRVGEAGGILSQNLEYLADELKKKHELQKKVIGTLVYPTFITVSTIGLAALLTAYIFPKLMPIFTSLHVDLPWSTRALIWTSEYLRHWGLLTLLGVVLVFVALIVIRNRFEQVRMLGDRVLLNLPLAGNLARAYNLTNFCRTLGLLLRSGITLAEGIRITGETTKNRVYREAAFDLSKRVIRGETVSKGMLEHTNVYPDILTQMLVIGEKTGSLSSTLTYLAEMYEHEVEDLTKGLSSSIEPVLMVVMGLLVGLIAVSVITPIYSITQHLSPK